MYRGHRIEQTAAGHWVYADTQTLVSAEPDRPCGHCGLANTPEGHDGCLGTLPDVGNACCGHGVASEAYVQLKTGTRLAGESALAYAGKC